MQSRPATNSESRNAECGERRSRNQKSGKQGRADRFSEYFVESQDDGNGEQQGQPPVETSRDECAEADAIGKRDQVKRDRDDEENQKDDGHPFLGSKQNALAARRGFVAFNPPRPQS